MMDARTGKGAVDFKEWAIPSGNRETCTGCGACAAACIHGYIELLPDQEGFLYPVAAAENCLECGRCEQVCPVRPNGNVLISAGSGIRDAEPLVFAGWHLNEDIRMSSSSGGVFTALAENILDKGGAVVGAAFDDKFKVRHILVDNPKELPLLRGSKYVQSEIPPFLFQQIAEQVEKKRPVLFSGTPCQVAGFLKVFENYADLLFSCDLVCHGVPSPYFLSVFLDSETEDKNEPLTEVIFRKKSKGWKNFIFQLVWRHKIKNLGQSESYMAAYLRNYSLRPCCYNCKFTNINRTGDLTIADFWGVSNNYPDFDPDDKGTSLILVNTSKGKAWLDDCRSNLFLGVADIETAIAGNPMLERPSHRPSERTNFYRDLRELSFPEMIQKYKLRRSMKFEVYGGKAKRKIIKIISTLFKRDRS